MCFLIFLLRVLFFFNKIATKLSLLRNVCPALSKKWSFDFFLFYVNAQNSPHAARDCSECKGYRRANYSEAHCHKLLNCWKTDPKSRLVSSCIHSPALFFSVSHSACHVLRSLIYYTSGNDGHCKTVTSK